MRFIIDTNIFIQLEDSALVLGEHFYVFDNLVRTSGEHELLCHPASIEDIKRDKDQTRRIRMLERIKKYSLLHVDYVTDVVFEATKPNDSCDDQILHALKCEAAHYLVTQDQGIHRKAARADLSQRVLTIQQASDLLSRLYSRHNVHLPSIYDIELFNLVPNLTEEFFDSLREGYAGFDDWFKEKAKCGRKAWLYKDSSGIAALCIYTIQTDEVITDDGARLAGKSLKLCTFKVAESVRGRKVGELLLKAAFRYATENGLENIFVHTDSVSQEFLIQFLKEFGFGFAGKYQETEHVYVKRHPRLPPQCNGETPVEYFIKYFPHYLQSPNTKKHIVPIQPQYHDALFPDFEYSNQQGNLFTPSECDEFIGNPVKQAYLCHASTNKVAPGDVLLFYRSVDLQAVTSIGVVEECARLESADEIVRLVKRRTVYSYSEITRMAEKPTKVILFRIIDHLPKPSSLEWLIQNYCLQAAPMSIVEVTDESYKKIVRT